MISEFIGNDENSLAEFLQARGLLLIATKIIA